MLVPMTDVKLVPLTTPEEVDAFLQQPLAGIFKAGTCHKTMQGFSELEPYLLGHDLPVGFIRVVDWRPASNRVAERSGVVHHSPQFLLFRDGQVVYDADNWGITAQALAPAFAGVPRRSAQGQAQGSNLEPYRALMQAYLGGQLNDFEFQDRFVTTFRDDATLRPQREFELLSSLFGDPDAYHGGLHQLGAPQERGDLRARVSELLEQL